MRTRYIILGLLMSLALSVSARTFVKDEEIYVNVNQGDAIGDWSKDGAKVFLYFFTDASHYLWMPMQQENGGVYKGVFAAADTYNQVIVVRGTSADWSGMWNQSPDINIPDEWNCIDNFYDAAHRWKMYSPALDKITAYAAGVTQEKISVCSESAGDPLSLKAKLNNTKTAYGYEDVHGHAWYTSADKSTWTSVDDLRGLVREAEGLIDTIITLPDPLPTNGIYYYLHSSSPAGRRLIYLKPDAAKCDLDCSISSFETAISAVNADDNTYTLDGMVAFGKANGKLVIECDGKSLEIAAPKSPQSFSLTGVPAATVSGKTTTATAYFAGDQTLCSKTITIEVPNSAEAVDIVSVNTHIGEPVTLTPKDAEAMNLYVWLSNGDTVKGASQVLVLDTFRTDTTITYTYKEYYPASGDMDDMMDNGSYEADNSDGKYGTYGAVSTISAYDFWGYYPQTDNTALNFYTDTTTTGINPSKLTSNGFAVVRNANHFAPSYATVTAREGNNFALFDAVTGAAGGNKKAWYATTAKNPKLKLQKGTTYVLSFWAANINNYGEMDNAARFVFRIEYNGKKWESRVLDLSQPEFLNNIWHQHSETFYAAEDCNNVTISVVNLNTNTLNIGNDFALDDIQFHPISSISKVVKSHQQFIVSVHKPVAFTDTICEGDSYVKNGFSLITPPIGDTLCINTIKDTLHLTVADGHSMLSKWNDVLFISNKDGWFVTYQWFKNHKALVGETAQRLYDPKGMSGTTDVYHCRMTTTDGKTIYTCPATFDAVTPSRTQNTGSSVQSRKIYDTMGRMIEGTPAGGIYIVVLETDGELVTTKLLIHE